MEVSAEAQSLHQRARQEGEKGDYRNALALLEKACRLAPDWPYPVYDMAYTLLLMKDYEGARECYRKTLELSPRGFFTAITALDTLEREYRGDLPPGTYLAYVSLEWMHDKSEKAHAVRQLVKQLPHFAPGWKELATLAEEDSEKLAAIEQGLAADPDAETKGMLNLNKALLLNKQGNRAVASRMLTELALNPNTTPVVESWAKTCLAMINPQTENSFK